MLGKARFICESRSMLQRPKRRHEQIPSHQSCSSTGRSDSNSRARREGPGWARARNAPSAAKRCRPSAMKMRLQYLTGKLGLNGVLAELNCGGLLSNEKVMRSLQLMCEEVAPCFR